MTKLIPDVINHIFSFMINDYDIWIPTIDYYYKIKMKINTYSVLIRILENMLIFKRNNPICKQIIQIYTEEGGRKTINEVYSFYMVVEGYAKPNNCYYYNHLIEYSYYYQNKLRTNSNGDFEKYQEMNFIVIYKNNDSDDFMSDPEHDLGFGAVVNGYHYYYKNKKLIKNRLDSSYIGYMSPYRLFPTIENATVYEFDEVDEIE